MLHRVCKGPAHGGEAVSLPLTEEYWYFRKTGERAGELRAPCKLCLGWEQAVSEGRVPGSHMVECKPLKKFLIELVQRCGTELKAARYIGIHADTIKNILHKEQCTVKARTAGLIVRGLDEKRREDRRTGNVSQQFLTARRKQAIAEERMNLSD